MHHHDTASGLDAHIRSTDPLGGGLSDASVRLALNMQVAAYVGEWSHTPARPRRRRGLALAATGLAVAGVAAAAATWLPTHTGSTLPGDQVAMGGPGEVLRLDGSDLPAVAERMAAQVPFPDGADAVRAAAIDMTFDPRHLKSMGAREAITTGAARAQLARMAGCAWVNAWLVARASHDRAAAGTALEGLDGLLRSRAVRDVDPAPSLTGHAGDAGPAPTVFGGFPEALAAAGAGDVAAVRRDVEAGGQCTPAALTATPWDGAG